MKMTRRRRRSSKRRKSSNYKESNNLSLQSDCPNITCTTLVDRTSSSPASENPTPSPVNRGAQSDQESSNNDSRKHGQGTSRSKLELDALDKTVGKITFQVLIRETLTEEVSVTIEHSLLHPKIIEPAKIISQWQPQCTMNARHSEHEALAEEQSMSSGAKVEIRTVAFSGDESTFLVGSKDECSKCQGHPLLLSCSAALNGKWDQCTDQSSWVKFRITTNDKERKVSGENYVIAQCEQCSYDKFAHRENHRNSEKVLCPIYRPSSSSLCIYPNAGDCTSSQNLMVDSVVNIPPPHEFADSSEDARPFSKTRESIRLSAKERGSESDISPITSADSERYLSSDGNEMAGSSRDQSSAVVKQECKILNKWERLAEYNHRVQALGPLATPSSSQQLGENKNSSRNNAIGNIDRIEAQKYCQLQPAVRRKTFPDSDRMDLALQMEWKDIPTLLCQSQSQSSHTHPPLFTQTLPRKKGKPERVTNEDFRSFSCFQPSSKRNCKDSFDRSRISCWSSSDTLSPTKSPEISSEMYGRGNASPCRFHSEESADDVFCLNPSIQSEFEGWKEFFRTDSCLHEKTLPGEGTKAIIQSDMDSWQTTDLQEQGDFTESGFDEETLDSDYPSELADDIISTNEHSRIQITPPSPSDHVPNHGPKTVNGFDTLSKLDSGMRTKTGDQGTEFKKRRHSVTILQTGAFDQRLIIQNNSRKIENANVLQHFSFLGQHYEEDTVFNESNTPEICEFEQDHASPNTVADIHTPTTTESLSQVSPTVLMDDCEENPEKAVSSAYEKNENNLLKNTQNRTITFGTQNKQNNSTEYSTQQSGSEQKLAGGRETLKTNMDEVDESLQVLPARGNFLPADSQPPDQITPGEEEKAEISCQMLEHAEKQRCHQDLNGETNCLLHLPSDPVQRDGKASEDCPVVPSREGSEHWAKRRQQFKERSSTGGSTSTSNQESVNSEETHSMDLAQVVAGHEQRGIYTDTYNSASWIFRGDEGNPETDTRCLGKRARPAAIRERTVKIAKGTGDYPWGFRIQFSKPILVTEVDTNGPAEEAGLQIGDIVLAVNGTDVTSIPHSEAATLARQGPDFLTLVVGSDISRCPNTPRPACRGYLHKRTHSGLLKGWRKRWFVLKHNGLFYYYKNKMDEGRCQPLDVMRLDGAEVAIDTSLGKPFVFKCFLQSRNRTLYFCSTSNQEMKRWLEAMERAIHPVHQNHVWVDVTHHNANLPPLAIKSPECLGLLHQVDRNKNLRAQHYCVLKDACLYFYAGIRSTHALGGIYLQGYTVTEQNIGSKRTIIEAKPPSEEFKTFYLCADNAADNKRWTIALKASTGRWLPLHQAIHDFMTNPPEETRM